MVLFQKYCRKQGVQTENKSCLHAGLGGLAPKIVHLSLPVMDCFTKKSSSINATGLCKKKTKSLLEGIFLIVNSATN
jgi:hypothetical protein